MREKEERKGPRIRVCPRGRHREESENEKKGRAGKEEEKETKSSFVVYMCHMYTCILKEDRGERNEMKRRARRGEE